MAQSNAANRSNTRKQLAISDSAHTLSVLINMATRNAWPWHSIPLKPGKQHDPVLIHICDFVREEQRLGILFPDGQRPSFHHRAFIADRGTPAAALGLGRQWCFGHQALAHELPVLLLAIAAGRAVFAAGSGIGTALGIVELSGKLHFLRSGNALENHLLI